MLLLVTVVFVSLAFLGCGDENGTSPEGQSSYELKLIGYMEIVADVPALETSSGLLLGGLGMHLVSLQVPSDPIAQTVGPQGQGTRYWDLCASAAGYIYAHWHYMTSGGLAIIQADAPFDDIAAEPDLSLSGGMDPAIVRPGGTMYSLTIFGELSRIDLSNPLSPSVEATCPAINTGRMRCFGDTLYLCSWSSGIYTQDMDEMELDPTFYVDTPDEAVDIVCWQEHAYIADRQEGVQVISRTQPPALVGNIPATHDSTEYVVVIEGMLYVSDGSLLQVFDISRPEAPALVAQRVLNGPCYRAMQHGEYVLAFSRIAYSPASTLGFYVLKLEEAD